MKSITEKYVYNSSDWKWIYINNKKTTYKISKNGEVVNTIKRGKNYKKKDIHFIKPILLSNGYMVVSLSIKGKIKREYIHRLVAKAFIINPNPDIYIEVNHINGDKKCNCDWNLEWVTSSENKLKAYEIGLQQNGEKNTHSIYTDQQIHDVCRYIEENKLKPSEISKITGVSVPVILDVRNYGSWKHISQFYDFSNYTPKQKKYTDNQINQVISLLKENTKSLNEISKITNVKYGYVWYIKKYKL